MRDSLISLVNIETSNSLNIYVICVFYNLLQQSAISFVFVDYM